MYVCIHRRIPLVRAKALANQFKIADVLYPIFSDDPTSFLYPSHLHQMNRFNNNYNHNSSSFKATKSTYRGYYGRSVAGTTALELLTNSNRIQPETTSVIIDHATTNTNDTYGIYSSHSTPQACSNHYLYYDQPDQSTTTTSSTRTASDTATNTANSLKSGSIDSADYSTASSCSTISGFQRDNHSNSRETEGCRIALL